MLDWASRIEDLSYKIAKDYAVDDREAVAILASSLIRCPRTPGAWLILETNWYSRECSDAWFSFGELWTPCSLPRLRARSPWREVEAEMKQWLESPSDERLFVEPDYDKYPRFHRLTQAQYMLQRSLRVRTRAARASNPLDFVDRHTRDRRQDEINALARAAVEDRAGARPEEPPKFIEPAGFLYTVELVQRLAPWYPDWTELVKAFATVAIRHAHLYGRRETGPEDYQAIARVAHDSIPVWIEKALRLLLEGPTQTRTLENHMALEEKSRRSGHGAHREIVRLHRAGVIEWNKHAMHWTLKAEHREGVRQMLARCAFGVTGPAEAPSALQSR